MKRLIFILTLLLASPAHAATVYISASGSGAQDGSSTTNEYAASAIQTAYNALACGDTLSAKKGDTFTYTTSPLSITKTGCSAASPITFSSHGSGADPKFQGDRNVASNDNGDVFALIADNVDYHIINGWDCDKFRVCWSTATSTSVAGLSSSNDGNGRITGWQWNDCDNTQFQVGWLIYGDDNNTCGPPNVKPGDDCIVPPTGASSDNEWNDVSCSAFSRVCIMFRNGNAGASINGLSVSGGGSTYDVSGPQQGQVGIDIGFTSASSGTPDSNITIENIQCSDLNNRQHGTEPPYRQGDCVKTEPLTDNIVIRRMSAKDIVDSCLDSKSINLDIYNSVCATSTHGIKSYSNLALGKQTRAHNVLIHDVDNPGGSQAAHLAQAFGYLSFTDSTLFNINENSTQAFKVESDFGESRIYLTNTIHGWDASGGTSLSKVGTDAGSSSAWFVDNNSNAYFYDGEGATSGTDPRIVLSADAYYLVSSDGNNWESQQFTVGWVWPDPPPSVVAPDAPTGFGATLVGTTANLSWTAPVNDGGATITSYSVERESPVAGGFSALATVTGEDLTNGDMEGSFASGVASSWAKHDTEGSAPEAFTQETTIKHAGSNSQKVVVDNHDEGLKQNITVADGASCTTTAWVYVPTGTDVSDVKLYAKEEGGDFTTYASQAVSTNDAWNQLTLSYTKAADGNQLRVSISASSPLTSTVTYYVDDASTVCGGVNTTYSDTGLAGGTQYNYRVKATNSAGTGSASGASAVTTSSTGSPPKARGCKWRGIKFGGS